MAAADSGGSGSVFPSGLRVLIVDDDMVCLKYLERLLRKCQYQVTGTNQALRALEMLREKKNEFDLVMSDVNMPDMDGFKLLEHVEFEMDIPVIMVSSHSEKELVYKGVTHGAVDYLLKPVRMEEVKNIWQHVVRKRKMNAKNNKTKSSSPEQGNQDDNSGPNNHGATAAPSSGSSDPNAKLSKKRKDNEGEGEGEGDDQEEGDSDENGREENGDSGTQKKARVVWSVELHKKFVQAVNQIGYDKAVPKKILDTMDVEGLTRENVASHLQKYRLYLKRMSRNIGGPEMSAVDELRYMTGPGRLSTAYHLGRYSLPSPGLFQRRVSSSEMQQLQPQQQTLLSAFGQTQQQPSSIFPSNGQSAGLFSPKIGGQTGFLGSSTPNPMMLQPHNNATTFGAQRVSPNLNQASFIGGLHGHGSSNLMGVNDAVQLPKFPPSSFDFSSGNFIEDYNPSMLNTNNAFVSSNALTTAASGSSNMAVFDNAVAGQLTNTQTQNVFNNYDPLDDMMSALVKREHNEGVLIDVDFGLDDAYQMGPAPNL